METPSVVQRMQNGGICETQKNKAIKYKPGCVLVVVILLQVLR